ncbi:MAG: hypothetical protein ACKORA_00420 [Solirubrobacterales bacterium]
MNENGVRLAWSGAGLSLRWSLTGPTTIGWAVAELLAEPSYRERAGEIARWAEENDGPDRGAKLIESLAG